MRNQRELRVIINYDLVIIRNIPGSLFTHQNDPECEHTVQGTVPLCIGYTIQDIRGTMESDIAYFLFT